MNSVSIRVGCSNGRRSKVDPIIDANTAVGIGTGEVWACGLLVVVRTGSADCMLGETLSLSVFSGDDPLPKTCTTLATFRHSTSGSACERVVIAICGGHVSLDYVALTRDQTERWEEDREECKTKVQGCIHSFSFLPATI